MPNVENREPRAESGCSSVHRIEMADTNRCLFIAKDGTNDALEHNRLFSEFARHLNISGLVLLICKIQNALYLRHDPQECNIIINQMRSDYLLTSTMCLLLPF
jgi:hypothetical protein